MTTAPGFHVLSLSAACTALLGFVQSSGAAAQTLPIAEAGSGNEIIITARRRPEPLGQAALAVSAVSGDEALDRGVVRTDQLYQIFPALTVQPTATGNLIFIRGVGNFTLIANSDLAVAFAYDGVFIGRPMGSLAQFFDLDRIELLKGPQGVLYGRNASAGSINLEPRRPVLGEESFRGHLSLASFSDVQMEAAYNLPLGESAALRVAGAWADQDNYLAGYPDGPSQRGLRLQMLAEVDPRIRLILSADYARLGGIGIGTSYVGNYTFSAAEGRYRFAPAPTSLSQGIYAPESQSYRQSIFLAPAGRRLDAIGSQPRQSHDFYGVHARAEVDLGRAQLILIPAWRHSEIDAIVSGSPFGYGQRERHDQTSLEARVTGRSGPVEWLAGTFLYDEQIDTDIDTNLSSSLILSDQRFRTRSAAAFGHLTLHPIAGLRLNAGLRWTRDRKAFRGESQTLTILCLQRIAGIPSCPAVPLFPLVSAFEDSGFPVPALPGDRLPIVVGGVPSGAVVARSSRIDAARLTDRALTWRLGAEWDLSPRTLIYAGSEKGYRPGGFNSATGFETYAPEEITAFTLGLRHRTLDDRLSLSLEAFSWNYRNQQVSSLRPDLSSPPRNANITDNIGSSRIRGIETELRLLPWTGATLASTIQYLDSRYRSFRYLQVNTGTPPLTGCDLSLNGATNLYTVDCTAQQPYNSPRWSFTLNGRQTIARGDVRLTGSFDTHFRSARNIGFAFLPEQRMSASWTTNLQLAMTSADDRLGVAAFVRNIEGDRVPLFSIFHPVSNALVASVSAPRTVGLRAWIRH